jgi:hypothetical protein
MPVSHEHRFVFVHIPKTGGTSVEAALGVHGDWRFEDRETLFGRIRSPDLVARGFPTRFLQHLTLPEIRSLLPDHEEYFSFAFVRNPWDRMVSTWSHPDGQLVRMAHNRNVELRGLPFEEFLARTADLEHVHLRPQHEFVLDEAGRPLVDFVGRFETIAADFREVCRRIGVERRLPHRNRSDRPVRDYRDAYTERTRQLVGERYRRDAEAFGYEL